MIKGKSINKIHKIGKEKHRIVMFDVKFYQTLEESYSYLNLVIVECRTHGHRIVTHTYIPHTDVIFEPCKDVNDSKLCSCGQLTQARNKLHVIQVKVNTLDILLRIT